MNRLIRLTFLILASLGAAAASPALARNVEANVEQIAYVMKAAGHNVEIQSSKTGRFVLVRMESYTFGILPFSCEEAATTCKSVQFFVAFSPQTKPTLDAMNTYARTHRWGRIYLDEEGDPAMEFDLDLEKGGMSAELFLDNIEYWDAVVVAYSKFVFGEE